MLKITKKIIGCNLGVGNSSCIRHGILNKHVAINILGFANYF
jgi:hypothetical protein